jgi:hypothetical protein
MWWMRGRDYWGTERGNEFTLFLSSFMGTAVESVILKTMSI